MKEDIINQTKRTMTPLKVHATYQMSVCDGRESISRLFITLSHFVEKRAPFWRNNKQQINKLNPVEVLLSVSLHTYIYTRKTS